jgi:hypothetical protein
MLDRVQGGFDGSGGHDGTVEILETTRESSTNARFAFDDKHARSIAR